MKLGGSLFFEKMNGHHLASVDKKAVDFTSWRERVREKHSSAFFVKD